MIRIGPPHLFLREFVLSQSENRQFDFAGWCVLRVVRGNGVCLTLGPVQSLEQDDVLVFQSGFSISVQASAEENLTIQLFCFRPELLSDFFTRPEIDSLALVALDKSQLRFFPSWHAVCKAFGNVCQASKGESLFRMRCLMVGIFLKALGYEVDETG